MATKKKAAKPAKKVSPKKAAPAKKPAAKPVKHAAAKKPVAKASKPVAKKPAPKKSVPKHTAKHAPVKVVHAKPVAKKELPKKPAPKAAQEKKPEAAKHSIPMPIKQAPPKPVAAAKPVKVVVPEIKTKTVRKYEPEFTKSVLDTPQQEQNNNGPTMRYNDAELAEFRELITKKLDAAKKELAYLQGLITRKDEMGGDNDDARYMTMEDGSMSMEREQLSQMASRQITFIDHLEKAMMRIENKTYGICRVTGKLIDKARLRAVPHATLSSKANNEQIIFSYRIILLGLLMQSLFYFNQSKTVYASTDFISCSCPFIRRHSPVAGCDQQPAVKSHWQPGICSFRIIRCWHHSAFLILDSYKAVLCTGIAAKAKSLVDLDRRLAWHFFRGGNCHSIAKAGRGAGF